MNKAVDLRESLRRISPAGSYRESFVKLLLSEARRKLLHYKTMDAFFRRKYGIAFPEFRKRIIGSEPDPEEEQDYFDWELAITGMQDMEEEINKLESILADVSASTLGRNY